MLAGAPGVGPTYSVISRGGDIWQPATGAVPETRMELSTVTSAEGF